jgi:3' terminal RNA ribose 2'-O-methyltransferase Hen1
MLLSISTTHTPAGDLGYLLHKHPDRLQTFNLPFGKAHVFYPVVSNELCTATLLLDVDPVGLVRGKGRERTLDQYVNDRPYVASSMLAVAIAQVFGTALSGICKSRPELVTTAIPLRAEIPAVYSSSPQLLRLLFEPLGYAVTVTEHPLDASFPEWGTSRMHSLVLEGKATLCDLLSHLYVLIPVLDDENHYYVGDDEIAKLVRHGEGWLGSHPEKELIASRYLKYRRSLASEAIRQLRVQDGDTPSAVEAETVDDPREEAGEEVLSLHQQRHGVIISTLEARGARRVLDLGCGDGRLIRELLRRPTFEKIIGMDVSHKLLETAVERLRLDQHPRLRERLELLHGSLLYADSRLKGYDAAVLCEVIEHMDEPRLATLESVVFQSMSPGLVLITTPNREYNSVWETLSAGSMRHADHRFEWTRAEFRAWTDRVAARFGYTCEIRDIGPRGVNAEGQDLGAPTQMGVFTRAN